MLVSPVWEQRQEEKSSGRDGKLERYTVSFPTRAEPHWDNTSVYISGTKLRRGALQRLGPGERLGPVAGVLVSGGCSQAASSIYLMKH